MPKYKRMGILGGMSPYLPSGFTKCLSRNIMKETGTGTTPTQKLWNRLLLGTKLVV